MTVQPHQLAEALSAILPIAQANARSAEKSGNPLPANEQTAIADAATVLTRYSSAHDRKGEA